MRSQANRNKKKRLERTQTSEASRTSRAITKHATLDATIRNVLCNYLGTRECLAGGKRTNGGGGLSTANFITSQQRLNGGFILYGTIEGGHLLSVGFAAGEHAGLREFGFEWIRGLGWYAVNADVDGLVYMLSFLKG